MLSSGHKTVVCLVRIKRRKQYPSHVVTNPSHECEQCVNFRSANRSGNFGLWKSLQKAPTHAELPASETQAQSLSRSGGFPVLRVEKGNCRSCFTSCIVCLQRR